MVRILDFIQALAATDNVEQSRDYVTLIKECADAIISLRKADQQSWQSKLNRKRPALFEKSTPDRDTFVEMQLPVALKLRKFQWSQMLILIDCHDAEKYFWIAVLFNWKQKNINLTNTSLAVNH